MNTILYRIPNKFFPGVIVKKPFHAKVNYDMKDGECVIHDVALSPLCLSYIDNTKGMVGEMKESIEAAERNRQIHPMIMQSISPFIKSIP